MPAKLELSLKQELARRAVTTIPAKLIRTWPWWEIIRTLSARAGVSSPVVDRIWDRLSRKYTAEASTRLRRGIDAIYAYEYTAFEAFNKASDLGVARILDFPSLNSRQYQELQRMEKSLYPELSGQYEKYFERKFERRQARRDAEMASADVIITNSSLSKESHINAGANPDKIFAVPYGAPPVSVRLEERPKDRPLRAIWAGTFSLRKGAHYFLEGWRALGDSNAAIADVYGAVVIPERLLAPRIESINFRGSVTRPALFEQFERSDVLVFPTLSDGFGMVVTEALACGLPVITTDQAGARDLVKHEHNGLIIPAHEPKAITDALLWCLDNRQKLSDMRRAALETASKWQWEDYRQMLFDVVETGLLRAKR